MVLELTEEQVKAGWTTRTLEDSLNLIIDHRGKTPKKMGGDWSESGHRVISAINMKNGGVDSNDHHYVDDEIYSKWMKNPVEIGDVFLTSEAPMGAVAYVSKAESTSWVVGQRIYALRANKEHLDGRYLYYLLQSRGIQEQLVARSSGTTVIGIKQAELRQIVLRLPPLVEQKRVAEILGSLDGKIEANNALLNSLDEYLRLDYVASIKQDKDLRTVSDIAVEVREGVSAQEIHELDVYVGLEYLPRRNVWLSSWGNGSEVTSNKSRFKKGDILFGKLRPYFHKVVVAPVDGVCSTDIIVVRPKPGFEQLALQVLSSDAVIEYATNVSNGTRMPRAKWSDLKDFEVRGFAELKSVASFEFAATLTAENRQLAETRDLLIRKLIKQ